MEVFFFKLILWGWGGTNICQTFCWGSLCNANLICNGTQLPGGGGGFFFIHFFVVDNLHLQIIASIFPKTSVENSSAQWAIFYI